MAGKVNWHDDEFKANFRQTMARRVSACAIIVEDQAKRLISKTGTKVAETEFVGNGTIGLLELKTKGRGKNKTTVVTGKKYKKGRRIYGANPSKPGEPPHKQMGHLRRSVTHERVGDKLVSRVGTNLKYGRWLELGTANMAARPWLRRALLDQARRIRRILIARIK